MSNTKSYNMTVTKKELAVILFFGLAAVVIVFFIMTSQSTSFSYRSCIENFKRQTVGEYLAERGLSSRIPVTSKEKDQVRKFILESDSRAGIGSIDFGDILKRYGTRPDNELYILFTDEHR